MQKNISLLGSTGSIGSNVLKVIRQYPGRFRIVGLAAGRNIALLRDQIEAFSPLAVSVATEELAAELARLLPVGWQDKIFFGRAGNELVATLDQADTVVSAIVGAAGLMPTLAAIKAGKHIALANKETLVMAGDLVMAEARRHKVQILPVDSEHNAIFQALAAGRRQDVHKIILTASGGPFRDRNERELWDVSPAEALNHPNWSMGNKISIDSATLMNKGLEVIEARWLFDMEVEHIEVLVHPQSIVHSLVEYIDGSVIAQLGVPDMRLPITYALAWPERLKTGLARLDLPRCMDLSFQPPDFRKFPALKLAYHACRQGGTMPAVLNAANEVAVASFLDHKIRFPEISLVAAETLNRLTRKDITDIETVLEADLAARMQAESIIEALRIKFKQRTGQEYGTPDLPPGQHVKL
ncbi:MAG: 1-deoxy-D-xylulose-5-phosphate reductoisomerase [Desulfurivibrio sp.]|nr:MAG: 1-deoxy-D-xylulose-5-phosphate reductoisomerase [Desulfurivibrio sp.]